jgi:hypothetical protein
MGRSLRAIASRGVEYGADPTPTKDAKGAAMEELGARAALVSAPDVGEGLTTSVSREEVQQALNVEGAPLELSLDVTRFSDGEPTETRNVAVAWERNDLEQLLRKTEGDRIVLTFDRKTLWQAMETDVEAHGIREKVLVLAVAATAATGAAASASAEPGPFLGSGGPAIQTTLGADDRAVSRATPAPEPSVGADDRAVSRATPAPEPSVGVDDRAVSRATPAPEPSVGVDDRAVSRATPAPAEPGTAADAGSWAPSPAETAAIGGAIALAITGATFLAAGRRRRPGVRPA